MGSGTYYKVSGGLKIEQEKVSHRLGQNRTIKGKKENRLEDSD
jgi:hypothetical protein